MNRRALGAFAVAILVCLLLVAALYALVGRRGEGRTPPPPAPTAAATAPSAPAPAAWWEVQFTAPIIPDDRSRHRGGPNERLVALIDRATRAVDVAIYDFDLRDVADALARAQRRGARVRVVTDSDTVADRDNAAIQAALGVLTAAGIPIVEDRREAIMHHKFTIIDGEWVSTGSWNYTDGDSYRLDNWMGVFRSPELAAAYGAEFEQLFAERRFGAAKSATGARHQLAVEGRPIWVCFAPKGRCADFIAEIVGREARATIHFLAFSFTHDKLEDLLIERARAGVRVQGVFETAGSQTTASGYQKLRRAGLDVHTDGSPYAMHHKVILVDERIVIAGSFNFSANADQSNDENLLAIEDPALAQRFRAEFDRVLALARTPARR